MASPLTVRPCWILSPRTMGQNNGPGWSPRHVSQASMSGAAVGERDIWRCLPLFADDPDDGRVEVKVEVGHVQPGQFGSGGRRKGRRGDGGDVSGAGRSWIGGAQAEQGLELVWATLPPAGSRPPGTGRRSTARSWSSVARVPSRHAALSAPRRAAICLLAVARRRAVGHRPGQGGSDGGGGVKRRAAQARRSMITDDDIEHALNHRALSIALIADRAGSAPKTSITAPQRATTIGPWSLALGPWPSPTPSEPPPFRHTTTDKSSDGQRQSDSSAVGAYLDELRHGATQDALGEALDWTLTRLEGSLSMLDQTLRPCGLTRRPTRGQDHNPRPPRTNVPDNNPRHRTRNRSRRRPHHRAGAQRPPLDPARNMGRHRPPGAQHRRPMPPTRRHAPRPNTNHTDPRMLAAPAPVDSRLCLVFRYLAADTDSRASTDTNLAHRLTSDLRLTGRVRLPTRRSVYRRECRLCKVEPSASTAHRECAVEPVILALPRLMTVLMAGCHCPCASTVSFPALHNGAELLGPVAIDLAPRNPTQTARSPTVIFLARHCPFPCASLISDRTADASTPPSGRPPIAPGPHVDSPECVLGCPNVPLRSGPDPLRMHDGRRRVGAVDHGPQSVEVLLYAHDVGQQQVVHDGVRKLGAFEVDGRPEPDVTVIEVKLEGRDREPEVRSGEVQRNLGPSAGGTSTGTIE